MHTYTIVAVKYLSVSVLLSILRSVFERGLYRILLTHIDLGATYQARHPSPARQKFVAVKYLTINMLYYSPRSKTERRLYENVLIIKRLVATKN